MSGISQVLQIATKTAREHAQRGTLSPGDTEQMRRAAAELREIADHHDDLRAHASVEDRG